MDPRCNKDPSLVIFLHALHHDRKNRGKPNVVTMEWERF